MKMENARCVIEERIMLITDKLEICNFLTLFKNMYTFCSLSTLTNVTH